MGQTPPAAERARLRAALQRPLREIPPIYFYDDHGSALFERITELPVYYQTRTEIGILEREAGALLAATRPRHLVELGSGAGRKIRLLLDAWRTLGGGQTCTMLDVNASFLEASLQALRAEHRDLTFRGIVGDFTTDLARLGPGGERLVVFFAGTIGNLYPDERRRFFLELGAGMAASDALLLGVDLVKDRARLEAAYDDPEGVTAAFNRNALATLNHRFGADFAPEAFAHRAFYDEAERWIEMRLRATRPMRVTLSGLDLAFTLEEGEELRTEISCKFTRAALEAELRGCGLALVRWCTDPADLFGLALVRPEGA